MICRPALLSNCASLLRRRLAATAATAECPRAALFIVPALPNVAATFQLVRTVYIDTVKGLAPAGAPVPHGRRPCCGHAHCPAAAPGCCRFQFMHVIALRSPAATCAASCHGHAGTISDVIPTLTEPNTAKGGVSVHTTILFSGSCEAGKAAARTLHVKLLGDVRPLFYVPAPRAKSLFGDFYMITVSHPYLVSNS